MTEPVSGAASGFAIGKALTAIAGFFGGLSVSFFWQPKKLHQYGKLAAGAIIGGIAVAALTSDRILAVPSGGNPSGTSCRPGMGFVVPNVAAATVARERAPVVDVPCVGRNA